MATPKVMVILLVVFFAFSSGTRIHSSYKWTEFIQLCSDDLRYLIKVICARGGGPKIELTDYELSHTWLSHCCSDYCSPYSIHMNYCRYPNFVDTIHLLIVPNELPRYEPEVTTAKIPKTTKPPKRVVRQVSADDKISDDTKKTLYCALGIKDFCPNGKMEHVPLKSIVVMPVKIGEKI